MTSSIQLPGPDFHRRATTCTNTTITPSRGHLRFRWAHERSGLTYASVREPEGKPKQRRWLAKWVKEESFWRDVITRTLAILISGAIIYIFALIVGYLHPPVGRSGA